MSRTKVIAGLAGLFTVAGAGPAIYAATTQGSATVADQMCYAVSTSGVLSPSVGPVCTTLYPDSVTCGAVDTGAGNLLAVNDEFCYPKP